MIINVLTRDVKQEQCYKNPLKVHRGSALTLSRLESSG